MTKPAIRTVAQEIEEYDALVASLFAEISQTERSAKRHCEREAGRLGDTEPARALRAASRHAERVLTDLSRVAMSEDLPTGALGRAIGEIFSNVRQLVTDRVIDAERSYRGTLLGLRHGVDLVRFALRVAESTGRTELAVFCAHWLREREPLVKAVEAAMSWFASRPAVARKRATVRRRYSVIASRAIGAATGKPRRQVS
jgi:hypothetical protein